jgi:hypothetical protein
VPLTVVVDGHRLVVDILLGMACGLLAIHSLDGYDRRDKVRTLLGAKASAHAIRPYQRVVVELGCMPPADPKMYGCTSTYHDEPPSEQVVPLLVVWQSYVSSG